MTGPRHKTPEQVALNDRIRELWGLGWSARQIGAELGVTRCAVIGRADRMDLASRVTTNAYKSGPRPRPKPPTSLPVAVVGPDEPIPLHLDMLDIRSGQCQWPYGDGPFTLCGNPSHSGPYCAFHNAKAYAPKSPSLQRMEAGPRFAEKQFGR